LRDAVETVLISADGYEQRSRELDTLRGERRREFTERLADARADDNAGENPAVHEVLEEQIRLERKIAILEAQLAVAEIASPSADGRAGIGTIVRVRDDSGATFNYELVGPLESDVENGRVSIAAPVGRALVDQRAGVRVDVAAPGGPLVLTILSVHPAEIKAREAA
jgi:transcription elongation factor GreA